MSGEDQETIQIKEPFNYFFMLSNLLCQYYCKCEAYLKGFFFFFFFFFFLFLELIICACEVGNKRKGKKKCHAQC